MGLAAIATAVKARADREPAADTDNHARADRAVTVAKVAAKAVTVVAGADMAAAAVAMAGTDAANVPRAITSQRTAAVTNAKTLSNIRGASR
jgi:hypothetical protein